MEGLIFLGIIAISFSVGWYIIGFFKYASFNLNHMHRMNTMRRWDEKAQKYIDKHWQECAKSILLEHGYMYPDKERLIEIDRYLSTTNNADIAKDYRWRDYRKIEAETSILLFDLKKEYIKNHSMQWICWGHD